MWNKLVCSVLYALIAIKNVSHAANDEYNAEITLLGGKFRMGSQTADTKRGELSVKTVGLKPFVIDKYPVTNENFRKFIRAKKFKTEAERFGWSFVFHSFVSKEVRSKITQSVPGAPWWLPVEHAYWRKPGGPGSSIKEKMTYPAVHISYNDAKTYCEWMGKRLPTEAEWEFAVRGELKGKDYPWGAEFLENRMNIWQGHFPDENTEEDGHTGVAPVDAFPAQNKLGMYDMLGNAWEWVADEFKEKGREKKYVLRGGSYIDTADGKSNHKVTVSTRMGNTADAGSDNIAFRCARSVSRDEL
ncbi:inactive C-alpha-formylglycine-generating enzyme 2-like [Acropora muricata]|uniref:inactive C-alpha-formylglycine-generating enzyme 2-like n=1 Tax=Acropora muricata TaxID=159855 RepID=UPI0034E3F78B